METNRAHFIFRKEFSGTIAVPLEKGRILIPKF
jgi:hypothetical protein